MSSPDPDEERAIHLFRDDPTFRSLVLLQLRMLQDQTHVFTDLALASALAGMLAQDPKYTAVVTTT